MKSFWWLICNLGWSLPMPNWDRYSVEHNMLDSECIGIWRGQILSAHDKIHFMPNLPGVIKPKILGGVRRNMACAELGEKGNLGARHSNLAQSLVHEFGAVMRLNSAQQCAEFDALAWKGVRRSASIENFHPLRQTPSHADTPSSAHRCAEVSRTAPNSAHKKRCQIYWVCLWKYFVDYYQLLGKFWPFLATYQLL